MRPSALAPFRPRLAVATAVAALLVLPAGAAAQEEDNIVAEFPARLVCEFPVRLEFPPPARDSWGGNIFFAGANGPVEVTNLATGESLIQPVRGTQARGVSVAPDGTETISYSGNIVLGIFPTDVPAGPALFLNTGRIVYTVSPDGVFTLQSQTGRTVDFCAALS